MTADINLISLIDRFPDDAKCREHLEKLRWPDGVACPRCGDMSVSEIFERNQWDCNSCRYQFSVTAGTIMHRSHLPLRKWFIAIYLMCEAKKGVSAKQLQRTLGLGSYKTAWHLCHRIREAMGNDPFTGPTLFGIVEVDETFVGGHQKGKGQGPYSTSNKTIVIGAVQRDGKVRLERIPNTRRKTLDDFVRRTVKDTALAIYTDEFPAYRGLGERFDIHHDTVQHNIDEWVVGDVHTNSVEGVWSLFKRSVMGSFHKISRKHMDRYLEELEWRFNNRDNPHIFRDTLRRIVDTDALTMEALTA